MSRFWAFPGQGAQQAGMLHALPSDPLIGECLREASDALRAAYSTATLAGPVPDAKSLKGV